MYCRDVKGAELQHCPIEIIFRLGLPTLLSLLFNLQEDSK